MESVEPAIVEVAELREDTELIKAAGDTVFREHIRPPPLCPGLMVTNTPELLSDGTLV